MISFKYAVYPITDGAGCMKKIRIVLADGNNLFVDSLKIILEKESELDILSGSNSGVEVLRSCIDLQPDLAVIGEVLHDLTMVEAAKEIKEGDVVSVNFDTGVITDETTGKTYQAEPFPEFIQNIIKKGGLIKSIM